MNPRIKLAVQKSGRLNEKSLRILRRAGITFDGNSGNLILSSPDFPIDLMLLRSCDIPKYVNNGICDLGIVGDNVLQEELASNRAMTLQTRKKLGFGNCRLSLAVPVDEPFSGISDFQNRKIATSYPRTLEKYLETQGIRCEIIEISGSVEIAPALGIADAICDLVSTGSTLKSNNLREIKTISESEAVLIQSNIFREPEILAEKAAIISRLLERIDGVMRAERTKYIMMNAPANKIDEIKSLIPGMEAPTIIPLGGSRSDQVAIQAVAKEDVFWDTMQALKQIGASSILVVPIEKIII